MPRSKDDLAVLAPPSVEIIIGGRTFVQKPLSLRGTARLVVAISEELQQAASSPVLASLLDTDTDDLDAVVMVPMLVQVLSSVPNALPRLITVILTGAEATEDVEFIDNECRLPQAMGVFRTFIEQNEPEELIENFMVLRSTLSDALSKAREKTAAPA